MSNRASLTFLLLVCGLIVFTTFCGVVELTVTPTLLPIQPTETISSTVAPDIGGYQGLVTDSLGGTAIAGALIVFQSSDGVVRKETITDANGRYRISLPLGRYRVGASHLDYQPFASEGFFVVPDTKYQTGNIFLIPKVSPTSPSDDSPVMGGFQGIVVDNESGTKVVGVRIVFVSEDGSMTKETTSSANGAYQVELPKGRYQVTASHDDYKTYTTGTGFFVVPGPGLQTGNIFLVPKTKPAAGCGGTVFAGTCWYHGAANISCDDVCASHGGYHDATRTYAGSDGSPANCKNVLDALDIPLDNFFETAQGGIGCFTIQTTSGNYFGYWDKQPTTASATSVTPGRRRICGCKN